MECDLATEPSGDKDGRNRLGGTIELCDGIYDFDILFDLRLVDEDDLDEDWNEEEDKDEGEVMLELGSKYMDSKWNS